MPVKREKAVEREKQFLVLIDKWETLEEGTIKSAECIMRETDNFVVKTIMSIIKKDSENHKEILKAIKNILSRAYTLTPEEVGKVYGFIQKHEKIEKSSIKMAEEALRNARNFAIRHLLNYILTDERKHHKMLLDLADFRRHLYPYG